MHPTNNLRAIDLNLLVVLDALLHERHLTRAAARLPMSQPAMSHALARLRLLLGDPLFHRTRGGLRPTPHALALEAPLREVLAQVRRLLAGAVFEPAASRRVFRLAMSDYGASVALPPLMRCLRRDAPGIDLEISYASRSGMIAGVADGQLDLALAVFGETPADIRRAVLFHEGFVCAADAGQGVPVTPDGPLARPPALVAARPAQPPAEVDAARAPLAHAGPAPPRRPPGPAAPRAHDAPRRGPRRP
ncbi:LysR family transcriptional regulator, partial [Achromobacter ruhlandii]